MGNDARKFERRAGGAFLVVGGVDAGGVQPDEHLSRPGAWCFHVADFDDLFGGTTFFVPPCQHVILPCLGAMIPALATTRDALSRQKRAAMERTAERKAELR